MFTQLEAVTYMILNEIPLRLQRLPLLYKQPSLAQKPTYRASQSRSLAAPARELHLVTFMA